MLKVNPPAFYPSFFTNLLIVDVDVSVVGGMQCALERRGEGNSVSAHMFGVEEEDFEAG